MKDSEILCELRIGIAESGPFFELVSHTEKAVTFTAWPHVLGPIWEDMCLQLGVEYVPPDWSAEPFYV